MWVGDLGDVGLTPESERPPGEGNGKLLQYSCLKNPMDRGAWRGQSKRLQRVEHSTCVRARACMHTHTHTHTHTQRYSTYGLDLVELWNVFGLPMGECHVGIWTCPFSDSVFSGMGVRV